MLLFNILYWEESILTAFSSHELVSFSAFCQYLKESLTRFTLQWPESWWILSEIVRDALDMSSKWPVRTACRRFLASSCTELQTLSTRPEKQNMYGKSLLNCLSITSVVTDLIVSLLWRLCFLVKVQSCPCWQAVCMVASWRVHPPCI